MTNNEWIEWKNHPVTNEWFDYISRLREKVKEEWANGTYTGTYDSETLQRNSAAIGQASLLMALVDVDFEEIEESKAND